MIRRILILLAALALCLPGLSAFAEEKFEAGELHVYTISMDENETVPVRAELVTVSDEGNRDYSAFYHFDRIRECLR